MQNHANHSAQDSCRWRVEVKTKRSEWISAEVSSNNPSPNPSQNGFSAFVAVWSLVTGEHVHPCARQLCRGGMYALALHLNPSTLSDHDSALYSLFWYFFSLESLLIKLCQQQETVCATLSCPDKQKIGVCDASLPNARLLRLPISEKGRKQQCGC